MALRKNNVSDEEIISLYAKIKSGIKVCKLLGISDKTVYDVLRNNGVETIGLTEYRKRITKFDDKSSKDVIAMYLKVKSAAKVANNFSCCTGTILEVLRSAGVEVKSRPRLTDLGKEKAKSLYVSGMTIKKIANIINFSEATISVYLHNTFPEIIRDKNQRGPGSYTWKGGRNIHRGYVMVSGYDIEDTFQCMLDKSGRLPEHRLVMARSIGRPLRPTETVHHIDGNGMNNSIENLQLRQGRHGKGAVMCCLNCGSNNVGYEKIGG